MIFVEKKISIIGGDLRIVNLAKMMAEDGFEVVTYALEKAEELNGLAKGNTLEETIQKSEYIVTSIPLSKDGKIVNTPYSDAKLTVQELHNHLQGKKLISGKLDESFRNDSTIECYDILEMEEYAVLNAIATAEGAIQIAMEEYPKTLSGSNILVMGFGRIGKILAKMLQGIGANVYCEARKEPDLAYIKAYGYTPIHLKDLDQHLPKFDIIINNIPVLVLDENRLNQVKKDVLILDLASNPGGVDFEYAKQNNLKTIWALALPGKVAPVSAAQYIRDTIYNILKP